MMNIIVGVKAIAIVKRKRNREGKSKNERTKRKRRVVHDRQVLEAKRRAIKSIENDHQANQ